MSILKDISELLRAGVITQDTADRIQDYYKTKDSSSTNRLFTVFGVLGAILVGLGIILIIAHNWDELSRTTKTAFAFLPLLLGQGLCVFSIIRQKDSIAWRESSAAFLFFSVGAVISLISQIYNIPGNLSSFLLSWMLLCFPLIYLMKSSITSLLYLIGITYYATETGYSFFSTEPYLYWLLLLFALPHYYGLYKNKPKSNFMTFHNWLLPLSVIIALGTFAVKTGELMFIAYFSLFGLLYLIGERDLFAQQKAINNGFRILGSLGSIIILLLLSFDWIWKDLRDENLVPNDIIITPEFIISIIISLLAAWLLYLNQKGKSLNSIKALSPAFILFFLIFMLGLFSPVAFVLINILTFMIGILTIREGAKQNHLGILNYGLIIITALVICRFFDTDLSFILRGMLFVSVGVGFFATNYWMLKRRKSNETPTEE